MSQPATETQAPGIRHPLHPDTWLVPPWPSDTGAHELVRHFQRYQPAVHASSVIQAAYYSGYAAVLAATPSRTLADELSWLWFSDLLGAVNRAATSAEAAQAAEAEAALDAAQTSLQLSLLRTCGLNTEPIPGQAS